MLEDSSPDPVPNRRRFPSRHARQRRHATQGRPAQYDAAGGGQRLSPGTCTFQFDPVGKARFDSPCDKVKTFLVKQGLPYSIPQIIKQVFRDLGFSDFEDALSRPYREWEYCVQYRETSFGSPSRCANALAP